MQGHYGTLDKVALASDAKEFEAALREQKTPVEMFYYEKAGHAFYSFLRPTGTDPGFDYCPAEAEVARGRMIGFLKKHLVP
ncbi:MAG: dienelactone hydrolase family protein [Planctomycetes bacterium]|nr:dienelactone hydrolase family protein [Planctomycetota bacterium]